VSFGSALTLLLVVSAMTLWVVSRFVQAWGRFFQALLNPPAIPASRIRIDPNPHYLKRAGQ
jgi:hypothetical protein